MTKLQKRARIRHKKWRHEEELAVRAVRDYCAKRLHGFHSSAKDRILRAVCALGVY